MSHSLPKDFGNNRKHRAVDRELQHRTKYNFVGVVRGGASQDALKHARTYHYLTFDMPGKLLIQEHSYSCRYIQALSLPATASLGLVLS